MNIDNIKLLQEEIRAAEVSKSYFDYHGFNINSFTHSCGTASCIGGYAVALARDVDTKVGDLYQIDEDLETVARNYLGLTTTQAVDLFYPTGDGVIWDDINNDAAVKVLQYLIETNVVDWSII